MLTLTDKKLKEREDRKFHDMMRLKMHKYETKNKKDSGYNGVAKDMTKVLHRNAFVQRDLERKELQIHKQEKDRIREIRKVQSDFQKTMRKLRKATPSVGSNFFQRHTDSEKQSRDLSLKMMETLKSTRELDSPSSNKHNSEISHSDRNPEHLGKYRKPMSLPSHDVPVEDDSGTDSPVNISGTDHSPVLRRQYSPTCLTSPPLVLPPLPYSPGMTTGATRDIHELDDPDEQSDLKFRRRLLGRRRSQSACNLSSIPRTERQGLPSVFVLPPISPDFGHSQNDDRNDSTSDRVTNQFHSLNLKEKRRLSISASHIDQIGFESSAKLDQADDGSSESESIVSSDDSDVDDTMSAEESENMLMLYQRGGSFSRRRSSSAPELREGRPERVPSARRNAVISSKSLRVVSRTGRRHRRGPYTTCDS
ncbi:unnamed protein product [Owenia fusiformis]|uniref:Uncharacterized protein n=1 Tax=Owenia fusiformis TaxID=6347 RepID=A0A8J1YCK6_OWEFU|nr:unnamed protein product [Owenia fusiformis]